MRVAPETRKLLREGGALSADDAEALQRHLEKRPDDIDAHARLLGYHEARGREIFKTATTQGKIFGVPDPARREALARQALWLAANAPSWPLTTHPLFRFPMSDPVYAELSSIWRRQAAADPPNPTVLANAIAFFRLRNDFFADDLLARAEGLFPGDRRWSDFRRHKRVDELELAFRLRSLRPHQVDLGSAATGHVAEDLTEETLDEVEQLLRDSEPESELIPRLRELAGELSFALGHMDRARVHAEQMLTAVSEPELEYSDAIHNGHLLLGRVALHNENAIERACAHLILAGEAGATGLVPIFGPDLRLATELLARGERDVVTRYLSLCRSFWARGPIDEWTAQIKAGQIPDFGQHSRRVS